MRSGAGSRGAPEAIQGNDVQWNAGSALIVERLAAQVGHSGVLVSSGFLTRRLRTGRALQ
jgi:hypothetical protein